MFDRAQLNRLSSYYEPALRLCRLALETSGIELDAGDVATPRFFFSMADVFEKAIERALREEFGRQNVHHQPEYNDCIRVTDGEPAIPVTFIPDNVIGPHDAPWLIVDAKYKKPLRENWGKQYYHNDDLYQAFTYADALDAPAVLVYPKVDQDVDVMFEVGRHQVRLMAVEIDAVRDCGRAVLRGLRTRRYRMIRVRVKGTQGWIGGHDTQFAHVPT
jgi:5-methylcytosine-specific restriction endonuclease McrBC regulatory subunit McrC